MAGRSWMHYLFKTAAAVVMLAHSDKFFTIVCTFVS